MKKRVILTICLCALSLSLTACTETGEQTASSGIASTEIVSDLSVPKASSDLLEVFSEEQVSSKEASSANTQTAAASSQKTEVSSQVPDKTASSRVASATSYEVIHISPDDYERMQDRPLIKKMIGNAIAAFMQDGSLDPYIISDAESSDNNAAINDETVFLDDDLTTLSFQNFSYQITSIDLSGKDGVVTIYIQNIDLVDAISRASQEIQELELKEMEKPEEQRMSQADFAMAISDIIRTRLLRAEMVGYTSTVEVVRQNDQWYLV